MAQKHFPKISVCLISYNSAKFLPIFAREIIKQDYPNMVLNLIDNNSSDNSVEILKNISSPKFEVNLHLNKENNGYVGASNQSFQLAQKQNSDYLMIINPDIVLTGNYISQCIAKMQVMTGLGAITGMIKRYDFDQDQPTDYIDSVGIYGFLNRRFVDFGQGQEDQGQFEKSGRIFGISGSCPIYRVTALSDILVFGELFDSDFFLYKEDIDISWRLRLRAWEIYYAAEIIGFHGRGTGILAEYSNWQVFKNRRDCSYIAKYHAFKNQRLMMLKNEHWQNLLKDSPRIIFKEILVWAYIFVFDWKLIPAIFELIRQVPSALKKRHQIQKNSKVPASEIRRFFLNDHPL
jgi:GT2 family glycosyltransferase